MTKTTTSSSGECAHCGKKIGCGSLFCSHECKENFDRRKQLDVLKNTYQKQKHEKIEKMACDILVHNNCCIDSVGAWEEAERFYDYAKQKQEEASDD